MKESEVSTFSWLDIIEPARLDTVVFDWKYYLLTLILVLLFVLFSLYVKLFLRLKLRYLAYALLKNRNARWCAKELLAIFAESKQLNSSAQKKYQEYRLVLTEACYAKNNPDPVLILEILKSYRKLL